jgi:hypothetical protein
MDAFPAPAREPRGSVMIRYAIGLVALLVAAMPTGHAAPMDAALQQQLLGIYDAYNKDLQAGKLQDAIELRSADMRDQAKKELATQAARDRFLAMAKSSVPDTIQAEHATVGAAGDRARIIVLGTKTIPNGTQIPGAPPPGTIVHSDITLSFVKESDGWKFDDQIFGPDPTKIATCKNDRFEPASAYDENKTVSLSGPIVRVDFAPDHTLVVVRVVDEDNCAFLTANKDELLKHGLAPDKLVPYAIVEIEGSAHRTDKLKVLVDTLTVQPEE